MYSTCSLNPIENEAVITEVLRRSKQYSPDKENNLEIVDTHDKLPGLKARKGLYYWDVLKHKKVGPHHYQTKLEDTSAEELFHFYTGSGRGDTFKILKNGEEVDGVKHVIPEILSESMFPLSEEEMKGLKIHYSMRIQPHD